VVTSVVLTVVVVVELKWFINNRLQFFIQYPMITFVKKDVVLYESIKGDVKKRPIYECRCDERLKTKSEGSTRLAYTGLIGGLEHLKIETKLNTRELNLL